MLLLVCLERAVESLDLGYTYASLKSSVTGRLSGSVSTAAPPVFGETREGDGENEKKVNGMLGGFLSCQRT